MQGQVIKIVSNRYTVKCKDKAYLAYARGRLRLGQDIFVGDNVDLELQKPLAVIDRVLSRKNKLIRPYVANIDKVIIVVAKEPVPDLLLADKVLLNCYKEGIEPIICYNKIDIATEKEVQDVCQQYSKYVPCVGVSSETCQNLEVLSPYIRDSLVCLAGQSAVGKTSILNALAGLSLTTDGLSQKIMRGKNTTRHIEIFDTLGGQIVDTCGFSMLDTVEMQPEELIYYYPEFIPLQDKCKYKSCLHISEPDCAVKTALQNGIIDKDRYERYTLIYKELKEAKEKRYE